MKFYPSSKNLETLNPKAVKIKRSRASNGQKMSSQVILRARLFIVTIINYQLS